MASVSKSSFVRPEDYLVRERLAGFKSEYYDGQVYAMAGASYRHNRIASNLHGSLYAQLRGQPCHPTFADLRLRTEASNSYTYPDLMVICGPPRFADDTFDTVLNPTVIIEILSPSTELWDRAGKFEKYQAAETLVEYVLVAQEKILVERYTRQADEWVLRSWKQPGETVVLSSIGCQVDLAEIYEGVAFESADL